MDGSDQKEKGRSGRPLPRKRKTKGTEPIMHNAIVPVRLVSSRVSQLDGASEYSGERMVELLKKQKRGSNSQIARSAAAVSGSHCRAQ
jgi:hypothetical protein